MSVKSIRRFDKYIPLFGKENDDRVTLLLGELEDNAINELAKSPANKNYDPVAVVLTDKNRGLWHSNFITPDPGASKDDDVHNEWKEFMTELGIRLAKQEIKGGDKLKIVRELKNIGKTTDELILCVLDNIATFTNKGSTAGRSFLTNFSELKDATSVEFKDEAFKIVDGLSNTVILADEAGIRKQLEKIFRLTADEPAADASGATVVANAKALHKADPAAEKAEWDKLFTASLFTSSNNQATVNKDYLLAVRTFVVANSKNKSFTYNYDKYLKSKLFDVQHMLIPVLPASRFFDDAIVDQGKYWRRPDGSLWSRDKDGKEFQVDIHSQKFKELKVDDKCFGTGFRKDSTPGGKSCGEYLRECLSGTDVTKCVEFLKKEDYWDIVKEEVEEMLPAIALKTLESFEFATINSYDESNKTEIRKVIGVTDWLINLSKMIKTGGVLDQAAYDAIAKNQKLKGYLELLVKKVNSNPSILNKHITKSDEQKRYNPDAFAHSKLASMGLKPRIPVSSLGLGTFERLANTIKEGQDAVRFRLGMPSGIMSPGMSSGIMGHAMFGGIMAGGSAQTDELDSRLSSENKQTWSLFQTHYLALVDQLKNHGKAIAEGDNIRINELLTNLKNSEVKLMQIMLMTEKYKDLLQIHGEKDGTSQLTVDHLKQFVDQRNKYFNRVVKKQNDLTSIIRSIAEAVQKEAPTKTEPLPDPKQEKIVLASLLG